MAVLHKRNLFEAFFNSEKTSGIILIVCTVFSLIIANSALGPAYSNFWDTQVGFTLGSIDLKKNIAYWINELLMAVFFLLVGLEIEREIYVGELAEGRKAMLPIMAAAGGMLIPGMVYYMFNANLETVSGFGIPMATDIAFALGILAMLGKNVPLSLKIFLTALAIIDDLGAIILIAIFYVKGFYLSYFLAAIGITIFLVILNRLKVYSLIPYLVFGAVLWYCLLKSGVHATITGVILAFVIPFKANSKGSPSEKLQHALHKPVAFIILPLFALANTGIMLKSEYFSSIFEPHFIGIFLGLLLGKPIGVLLFSFLALKLGWARISGDLNLHMIFGVGFLAGIGFTMAIFISLLAFEPEYFINTSKIAILSASLVAGILGYSVLKFTLKKRARTT
jgi:NhaA family Na+:H+ antiporter